MSEIAIRVEDLSKQYEIGAAKRHDTLRDQLMDGLKGLFRLDGQRSSVAGLRSSVTGRSDTIWALKDVSFEVKEGEIIGIIGRNGAGKSTLLKILSHITEPTSGRATIYGRVGSLLEVGTGFHQELTGRENIYLNGAMLGMKKAEIDRKFDEIVTFAETERFLDTPVKRYSSGMYVRLAFAVAAHLEPEILLVDEVLAVGDAAFQKKCLGKMGDVAKEGRTVLFVSHNMTALEHLCHKGIVLDGGSLAFMATSREAIDYYLHRTFGKDQVPGSYAVDLSNAAGRPSGARPLLKRLELFTDDDRPLNGSLRMGASFKAHIYFRLEKPSTSFEACLAFDNLLGQRILVAHSLFQPNRLHEERSGDQVFVCEIPSLTLVPGEYRIVLAVATPQGVEVDRVDDAMCLTVIDSDYYGTGKAPWDGFFVLKHRWYLH